MEFFGILLATFLIVLWLGILLAWLISFGTTLDSADAWPSGSVLRVQEHQATAPLGNQTAA
jgi:hypothetical protein